MLTYFINRGGKGLSKTRRADTKNKALLSKRVARERADANDRKPLNSRQVR